MGRSRSLGTHLALTHGLIALLGCAISGGLLALFLPTIYLRQHEDHLLRQAEGVAGPAVDFAAAIIDITDQGVVEVF